jgi:hypothetical protein
MPTIVGSSSTTGLIFGLPYWAIGAVGAAIVLVIIIVIVVIVCSVLKK